MTLGNIRGVERQSVFLPQVTEEENASSGSIDLPAFDRQGTNKGAAKIDFPQLLLSE